MGSFTVNIKKFLTKKITYWAPNGRDGFGAQQFASPSVLSARWESKLTNVKNAKNEDVQSDISVWTEEALLRGGYVMLSESTATDPTALEDAREILSVEDIPSIDGITELHKAYI